MKKLLTITAIIEAATGLGLLAAPAVLARLLLGGMIDTPAALTVARVGGSALLAISVACWLSRENCRALVAQRCCSTMLSLSPSSFTQHSHLRFRASVSGRPLLFTSRSRSGAWRACGTSGYG